MSQAEVDTELDEEEPDAPAPESEEPVEDVDELVEVSPPEVELADVSDFLELLEPRLSVL